MFFVIIKQDGKIVCEALLQSMNQEIIAPLFEGETYDVEIFDVEARLVQVSKIVARRTGVTVKLATELPYSVQLDMNLISQLINQLASRPKGFDDDLNQKIIAIRNMHPEMKYKLDSVRGGRLEQLFYLLLLEMKKRKIIENVEWHGHVDQYGIPFPAPGRSRYSLGNPDFLIHVNDVVIVLELTLLGQTRKQWSFEGESVPDHILGVKKEYPDKRVIGVFSAPAFYRPEHLKAVAISYSITLKLCELKQLVSILIESRSSDDFLNKIMSLP
jgi:hypothetical protein